MHDKTSDLLPQFVQVELEVVEGLVALVKG